MLGRQPNVTVNNMTEYIMPLSFTKPPITQHNQTHSEVRVTTFFVPGIPAPQGSKSFKGMRKGKPVLVESSDKVAPWRDVVALIARQQFRQPLIGPIRLEVEFVMPRTKAMGKKPAPPMTQQPDTDKLIRSTCDALSGVAYGDDAQVTEVSARKRRAEYGEKTGATVSLSMVESPGHMI